MPLANGRNSIHCLNRSWLSSAYILHKYPLPTPILPLPPENDMYNSGAKYNPCSITSQNTWKYSSQHTPDPTITQNQQIPLVHCTFAPMSDYSMGMVYYNTCWVPTLLEELLTLESHLERGPIC